MTSGSDESVRESPKYIAESSDNPVVPFYTPKEVAEDPNLLSQVVAPSKYRRKYDEDMGELVLDYYISGLSLTEISRIPGMPSRAVLMRWHRDIEEFREKLDSARSTRALYFEERALETSEINEREEVPVAKHRFEVFQWAAEKADPTKYGKQSKIQVESDQRPVFVVNYTIPENEYLSNRAKEEISKLDKKEEIAKLDKKEDKTQSTEPKKAESEQVDKLEGPQGAEY